MTEFKSIINKFLYIGKIAKLENSENIFIINNFALPQVGMQIIYNDEVVNVYSKCYVLPDNTFTFTVVKFPDNVILQTGDEIVFSIFDIHKFRMPDRVLKLDKLEDNIMKEMKGGKSYYQNNLIEIFPHGKSQNTEVISSTPNITTSPSIFGEYLFSYVKDMKEYNTGYVTTDVYIDNTAAFTDVVLFSADWVGINYNLLLNDKFDVTRYSNFKQHYTPSQENTASLNLIYNNAVSSAFGLASYNYSINKNAIKFFQEVDNISQKILTSDINKVLDVDYMVEYRKYANCYNYIKILEEAKFYEGDIYSAIKDNIDQNGFTSITEYQYSEGVYNRYETRYWSESGQYNRAGDVVYMIYSSDSTILDGYDSTNTIELIDFTMAVKLRCLEDSTSYIVENAFFIPIDFMNDLNWNVIKMHYNGITVDNHDKWYYYGNNINMVINFTTGKVIYQRVLEDGDVSAGFKYAPKYNSDSMSYWLYNIPNLKNELAPSLDEYQPLLFDYNMLEELTDAALLGMSGIYNTDSTEVSAQLTNNKIGYSKFDQPIVTRPPYISDVMFNNSHTEMYLKLNMDVWNSNLYNLELFDVTDENVMYYHNGTISKITDENAVVRVKNKIIENTHTIFNKNVVSILNVDFEYDPNADIPYTTNINYDVYGDSVGIERTINNGTIDDLMSTVKDDELAFILLKKDTTTTEGTMFENYPSHIVIKVGTESIIVDDEVSVIKTLSFPSRLMNLSVDNVMKYYRYKQFNRFKNDYLDKVFNIIQL